MSKCNVDIRTSAIKSNVFLWEIANELGISEPTITRKLRAELSAEEKNRTTNTAESRGKSLGTY